MSSQFSFLDDGHLYGDKTATPAVVAAAGSAPPLRAADPRQTAEVPQTQAVAQSQAAAQAAAQAQAQGTGAEDCEAAVAPLASALMQKMSLLERRLTAFEVHYSKVTDDQQLLQRSLLSCQTSAVWILIAVLVLLCIVAWKVFVSPNSAQGTSLVLPGSPTQPATLQLTPAGLNAFVQT